MPAAVKRPARLEARLPGDVHALLKRAADIQGRSLTDFVVASAHEAALRTIEADSVVRLTARDQMRFAEALLADKPASAGGALKRAKERRTALIRRK